MKNPVRYEANFSANGTTYLDKPIMSSNKNKLISTISSIANLNRFEGNTCSWSVKDILTEKTVAIGATDANGKRYRFEKYFN